MPKFSIILPVSVRTEERRETLNRALESIEKQTFRDFEVILINDGSTVEFTVPSFEWLKIVDVPHGERIIAANAGFRKVKGKWICQLDSDDEYDPQYLEKVNEMIKTYPKYNLFNFGVKYIHHDGHETFRDPFEPKKLRVGHETFGGGTIVKGTYVFSKKVLKDLKGYPPPRIKEIDCTEINYGGVRDLYMNTPYDFSAYAQLEFPEIRQYFMVNHEAEPHKIIKELGNPWGDDFYIFYKFTRKYHSKPVKEYLYIAHPRL